MHVRCDDGAFAAGFKRPVFAFSSTELRPVVVDAAGRLLLLLLLAGL